MSDSSLAEALARFGVVRAEQPKTAQQRWYERNRDRKMAEVRAKRAEKVAGRVCAFRGCNNLLGDIHPNRKYCNITCRNRELRKRNPNQDISSARARENKRIADGIKLVPETPSIPVYAYKEPLSKFVRPDGKEGYGYKGTLMSNEEKTHVQCHFCGFFFEYLPGHVHTHGVNAKQYKLAVGLSSSTALVSEKRRDAIIEAYRKLPESHHERVKSNFNKYNEEVSAGLRKHGKKENSPWNLERRNKEGLCPDQLLDKITQLQTVLGHSPTIKEFNRHYKGRYATAITVMYGSWNKAVKLAGGEPRPSGSQNPYTDEQLLEMLRKFYKERKRVPTHSDMKNGILPAFQTYIKRFGSLNHARAAAGIPIYIPLAGRKFVEVELEHAAEYGYNLDTMG